METAKISMVTSSERRDRSTWVEHREFLEQLHYNGRCVSLHICPNSQNVQHQE